MTSIDLEAARRREAIQEEQAARMGAADFTLADGLRWEAAGLGRVFFVDGTATWHPGPQESA